MQLVGVARAQLLERVAARLGAGEPPLGAVLLGLRARRERGVGLARVGLEQLVALLLL